MSELKVINVLSASEKAIGTLMLEVNRLNNEILLQNEQIEQLRKVVEDTIGQAFYEDDYHKAQAEIEALKEALKNIIVISDRKHDAWDRAKELIKEARKK